jgi:hypothetical protein
VPTTESRLESIRRVLRFQVIPRAPWSASSRAVSLKALNRHAAAPRCTSSRRRAPSAPAVMNTIGMFRARRLSSSCRPGPLDVHYIALIPRQRKSR